MKNIILILLALAMVFIIYGCAAQNEVVEVSSGQDVAKDTPPEPPVVGDESEGEVKQFEITAKNWEWVPSTITVNKGDTVVLSIHSIDVDHGIAIPTFNVNEKFKPGQVVEARFVADQAGEFPFYCNVFCGSGHRDMRGTLIVNE